MFGIRDANPDPAQRTAMTAAKDPIHAGLARAALPGGRVEGLPDEWDGLPVVEAAHTNGVVLAVPVESNGCGWEEAVAGRGRSQASEEETIDLIALRYLRFARRYCAAGPERGTHIVPADMSKASVAFYPRRI
jgi:hypothetical protein